MYTYALPTEQIFSLLPATIKYFIERQYNLIETEPFLSSPAVRLENQIRRRCFWFAYALYRLVMDSFDLLHSIAAVCQCRR
ncbi:hypothetical protein BX600DRAFT_469171 [Xylariales sp. PMI_506]|nr:hypothetical protein BX600DRAFT_469171 [Xylariales sp. PMI_506]